MAKKTNRDSVSARIQTTEGPKEMELPLVNVPYEAERTEPIGVREEKCICEKYEGHAWGCPKHESLTECPVCHCIKAERLIPGSLPPMNNYQCKICGIFYMRNMVNGDYLHYT